MTFEIDSRILNLLKAKAEKEGVQLQELLEAFARS